jgi:dTDP-4-amino-4,6-dideoxygalactose transaminase
MEVPLLDLKAQYAAIKDDVRAAVDAVFESQQFIGGPAVERLERQLAEYLGCKHAVAVSSGTDALLAAFMALDIGPGDEVVCPPFTFFATAGCIARTGARPVFVDIDPATFNLDPARLEAAITPRTKAVMPVHLFGQMADMEAICEVACRRNLAVVEDAAQAIGARRNGKPAGAWSVMACFSFFPSKNLGGAGDGGLVTTDFDRHAERLRMLRNHGMQPKYHHPLIGGNFRLDALQAAVLSAKLPHLESWHSARRRNAAMYDLMLEGLPLKRPTVSAGNSSVVNQYTLRIPGGRRDALRAFLSDRKVGTEVYYPVPLHLQKCFAHLGHKPGDFPAAEAAAAEVVSLPIYPELKPEQIRHVADSIREFFR